MVGREIRVFGEGRAGSAAARRPRMDEQPTSVWPTTLE